MAGEAKAPFKCSRCNGGNLGVRIQTISGVPTVQVFCKECGNAMHATFPSMMLTEARDG
jgi:RNase P subunit RPR2